MNTCQLLLSAFLSYLVGSIPFGYLAGLRKGIDIRTVGSGNIGATNVFRTLGKRDGIVTFLLDVMKGVAATCVIPQGVALCLGIPEVSMGTRLACAVTVLLGHGFPVFLNFRGGKGVATGLGIACGIVPHSAGLALLLWILVFLASRYVSLASCLAAAFVAVAPWWLDNPGGPMHNILPALISVLASAIVLKHHSNIKRLVKGTENRFCFTRRQLEEKKRRQQSEQKHEL